MNEVTRKTPRPIFNLPEPWIAHPNKLYQWGSSLIFVHLSSTRFRIEQSGVVMKSEAIDFQRHLRELLVWDANQDFKNNGDS